MLSVVIRHAGERTRAVADACGTGAGRRGRHRARGDGRRRRLARRHGRSRRRGRLPPAVSPGGRGARLKAAATVARAPWLLFLEPGIVPDATWIDETRRFMEDAELQDRAATHAAVFRPARPGGASRPILIEALALLRTALGARPMPQPGPADRKRFTMRSAATAEAPERDLARRLGRRRIVMLRSGTHGGGAAGPLLDSVK